MLNSENMGADWLIKLEFGITSSNRHSEGTILIGINCVCDVCNTWNFFF